MLNQVEMFNITFINVHNLKAIAQCCMVNNFKFIISTFKIMNAFGVIEFGIVLKFKMLLNITLKLKVNYFSNRIKL